MSEPRFAEKVDLSEVVFTRFQPGDDLFEMIRQTMMDAGWNRAVILSGIGSVGDVAFVDPKPAIELPVNPEKVNLISMKGPFELMSLEGNVVPLVGEFSNLKEGDPVLHLHAILGHEDGRITGGHMVKAKVFTTTELFLAHLKESKVKKRQSGVTGLTEMRDDL
jgi:predicted DNA-binding protein with PD1-like motif